MRTATIVLLGLAVAAVVAGGSVAFLVSADGQLRLVSGSTGSGD